MNRFTVKEDFYLFSKSRFLRLMYGIKNASRYFPMPSKFYSRDCMAPYHPVNG